MSVKKVPTLTRSIRISAAVVHALDAMAKAQKISVNQFIGVILSDHITKSGGWVHEHNFECRDCGVKSD